MPHPLLLESVSGESFVPITQLGFGTISFGREPENNVVIDSSSVSRVHCVLAEAGTQWVFRDNNSTNGSWVNGVKIEPGQLKLVRSKDVIQVADFPIFIRESQLVPSGDLPNGHPSILVFFGDRFKWEFSFSENGALFHVGGPEGDLQIDGEPQDKLQFSVGRIGERLELQTVDPSLPVVLSGLSVSGTSSLVDSNMIEVGPYRLLVNDLGTRSKELEMASMTAEQYVEGGGVSEVPLYSEENLPPDMARDRKGSDSWLSEAAKRRDRDGRDYVFGNMGSEALSEDSRTAMNPAIGGIQMAKFGMPDGSTPKSSGGAEKLILAAGIIVIMLILGVIAYLLTI